MVNASPWRRVLAFMLDYLVIALYLGVLAGLTLIGPPLAETIETPWQAHILGFISLTLPVTLYFALAEYLVGGTLGKYLLAMQVEGVTATQVGLGSSLLRSALKFLPWELSHIALYRVAGWPRAPEPLVTWQVVLFSTSLLLVLVYLVGLFAPPHRPLYDRLSGAVVKTATPHPATAFKEAHS